MACRRWRFKQTTTTTNRLVNVSFSLSTKKSIRQNAAGLAWPRRQHHPSLLIHLQSPLLSRAHTVTLGRTQARRKADVLQMEIRGKKKAPAEPPHLFTSAAWNRSRWREKASMSSAAELQVSSSFQQIYLLGFFFCLFFFKSRLTLDRCQGHPDGAETSPSENRGSIYRPSPRSRLQARC